MSTNKYILSANEKAFVLDGFNDAIIGIHRGNLVYSLEKIISILSKDMSEEEAVEYYSYNILGVMVNFGQYAPVIIEGNVLLDKLSG